MASNPTMLEWASNGICAYGVPPLKRKMIFYYQGPCKGKARWRKSVQGVRVTIIYPVMSQGVFLSPTYPAMPRLAFAKGSLTPRAGGS